MSAKILSGKEAAESVKAEVREKLQKLKELGITPGLAVVVVGEDPASAIYVASKERTCHELGINSYVYRLPAETSQEELQQLIETLNVEKKVNGILVQFPLPKNLDEKKIIETIDKNKDVDCFHPYNVGKLLTMNSDLAPCTPAGIIRLLKYYEISLAGKHAVVIGRSNLVGKPLFALLLTENATVTICHSHTHDLDKIVEMADIVIAAVGRPKLITAEMIKPGAVVVDVGINRLETGKIVGDVDFDAVKEIAFAITPVPGGVGLMTIAMLMENVLNCASQQ